MKITRLLAICFIVSCAGCMENGDNPAALGTLERDRIELTGEPSEAIIRIQVREGDRVEAGAILVQQDTSRADVALEKAEADKAVALSRIMVAEAGPRQQQISGARARLEVTKSALNTIRIELNRTLSLIERKLASQNQVDLLQGKYNESLARVNESKANLDELLEGTRSEEIDQARSGHVAAVAVVRNLMISRNRATTLAPLPGIIEALPFEVGERPMQGATVVALLATGRIYARVHVSEPLKAQLAIGDPAYIHLDSRNDNLEGQIRWISTSASFTPYFALNQHDRSRLSYLAEIDLNDNDMKLPVGVPVEVTFPGLAQ
jgi:HlyD family secretion protein